jgi:hypothetical protein
VRAAVWVAALLVLAAVGVSVGLRFWKPDEPLPAPGYIRFDVVNASGRDRVGREVLRVLQARAFNVYAARTADSNAAATAVVDLRDPAGGNALRLAQALSRRGRVLGLPLGPRRAPATRVGLDSARYLEALLVVGADYRRYLPEARPLR